MRGGGDEEQFWPHARLNDPEQLNADVAEADGIRCHEEDEEDAEETEGDPGEDVRHRVNFACVKPAHCSTTRQPANFCAKRSERGGGAQLPTDRVVKLSSCQVVRGGETVARQLVPVKLCEEARRQLVNLWPTRLRDVAAQLVPAKLCKQRRCQPVNLWSKTSERRHRSTCAGTQVVRGDKTEACQLVVQTPERRRRSTCAGTQVVRGGKKEACQLVVQTPERQRRSTCAGTQVVRGEETTACQLVVKDSSEATSHNLCGHTSCARRRGDSLSTCGRRRLRGDVAQLVRAPKLCEARDVSLST